MSTGGRTLVVVTGTGTEIGKTWVAARVLEDLTASGLQCAARKPAQSFDPTDPSPRDATVLAGATGEQPDTVCPPGRNYAVAMAPPMAADALGLDPVAAADLAAEVQASLVGTGAAVVLVELAGGVRSPLAHDADCARFAWMLAPGAVVLVADAGLGTINAVVSALDSLAASGLAGTTGGPEIVVHLNRHDPADDLHRRNRQWLEQRLDVPVTVSTAELAATLDPRR